jgi:hypothetical protein
MTMNPKHIVLALPLLFSPACGQGEAHGHADAQEQHRHTALHPGAVIVEVGEHFAQMEVALDPETGALSLWLLDHDNSIRIEAPSIPVELTVGDETFSVVCLAQASPLTGESVGDSSEFKGLDERLAGVDRVTGVVGAVKVRGASFSGLVFDWPREGHE